MKKLLNTLYLTAEGAYLSLDGENIVASVDKKELGRVPLHTLQDIVIFGRLGASPALLGKCAEYGKNVTFLDPYGKFQYRVSGKTYGNVILRRKQFRIADNPEASLHLAQNIIAAKLVNSAAVLRRAVSDHSQQVDIVKLKQIAEFLRKNAVAAYKAGNADSLRGLEGDGAKEYFSVFDELILQKKEGLHFSSRSRRPPMDPVNAMLSFGYTLMTSICVSALEGAGLDPYVGVFHTDRPGRCSLALDLTEEFREPFVDRFVLSLINKKLITRKAFQYEENGAVLLNEDGRRLFLEQWQRKKRDEIVHPYLKEKMEWGMIPYVQAMLLAKFIRGDLDDYPPFFWK